MQRENSSIRWIWRGAAVVPLLALSPIAHAQTLEAFLTADDAAVADSFGIDVAISGDLAIIGSRRDDHGDPVLADAGAAYIFQRSGCSWEQEAKLTASDALTGHEFGAAVAIDGDVVIIGAHGVDMYTPHLGKAYVFRRQAPGSWTEEAILTATDGLVGDMFGFSVAIDGDRAVVGARFDDFSGYTNPGSAYVFTRVGGVWSQQQKLTVSVPRSHDWFGDSVGISGDWIVASAPLRGIVGSIVDCGAAYTYLWNGASWMQIQEIWAYDRASNDWLGNAVAIDGDAFIVGARGDNSNRGSAYVYRRSGSLWSHEAKLMANDGAPSDNFGAWVSMDGDRALVGADYDDHSGILDCGAAYSYSRATGTWLQESKITPTDAENDDHFGTAVWIDGDSAIVGCPSDTHDGGVLAGSSSVYDFGIPCPTDTDCNGSTDFQDLLAMLAAWSPDPGSCPGCAADVDGDNDVDFQDLLALLAAWGPCP